MGAACPDGARVRMVWSAPVGHARVRARVRWAWRCGPGQEGSQEDGAVGAGAGVAELGCGCCGVGRGVGEELEGGGEERCEAQPLCAREVEGLVWWGGRQAEGCRVRVCACTGAVVRGLGLVCRGARRRSAGMGQSGAWWARCV